MSNAYEIIRIDLDPYLRWLDKYSINPDDDVYDEAEEEFPDTAMGIEDELNEMHQWIGISFCDAIQQGCIKDPNLIKFIKTVHWDDNDGTITNDLNIQHDNLLLSLSESGIRELLHALQAVDKESVKMDLARCHDTASEFDKYHSNGVVGILSIWEDFLLEALQQKQVIVINVYY